MAFQPNSVPVLLEAAITTAPAAGNVGATIVVAFNGGAPLQHTYQVIRMFFRKTDALNGAFADSIFLNQTTPGTVSTVISALLSLQNAVLGVTSDFVASNAGVAETAATPITLVAGNTLRINSVNVVSALSDLRGIVYIEAYRVS